MADEEEGTQGGDFPEEEHPCEAVAEDEAVHRAKEQQQEEEKAGLLGFGEAEMILMLLHVAEAENAHDPADEGDHEHHDEGQRIRKECGGLMAFQHEEIEVDHTGQLAERETHGQPVAYIPVYLSTYGFAGFPANGFVCGCPPCEYCGRVTASSVHIPC